MTDYFNERFANDAASFQILNEGLEKDGYVTEDEGPFMNRPTYNSLSHERYQQMFKMHNPGHSTEVTALCAVFDVGHGFPTFYVAFDSTRFKDSRELKIELKKKGVLK